MNKSEYLEFHKACCEKMMSITKTKNSDYTGITQDPFSNFRQVETLGITDAVRGFLVRMTDKLARVTSFAQKGAFQVKDESVEDTLLDLANYSILLAAFIKSEKYPGFKVQSTNPALIVTPMPDRLESEIRIEKEDIRNKKYQEGEARKRAIEKFLDPSLKDYSEVIREFKESLDKKDEKPDTE